MNLQTRSLPLVSIVIPSYNHGRYLRETIDSILAQDYPRVELIVIDDGSTDNSREVLAAYGKRFRWEAHPNQGQVAALTRAWAMCNGEIMSWIGADDVMLPDAVSTAVKTLTANPAVVLAYGDFNLIGPDGRVIRRLRTADFSYLDMVVQVTCPPGPGAFFRRSAFEATGPWDPSLKIMLDYDYWLRLGLQGPFLRIPKVLSLYRIHEGQETFSRMDPQKAAEPVRVISSLFEKHQLPPEIAKLKNKALSNAHLVSAQLNFRGGRYRLSAGELRAAFALWPANLFTGKMFRLVVNVLFNRTAHKVFWKISSLRGK